MPGPGLLEITMTNRLDGKVAIVVGAAARGDGVGNGSAVARLFAQEGAKVVLVNRTEERATRLRDEIVREGGAASVFAANVTVEADVEKVFAHCVSAFGRVDILHNNVGSVMP